MVRPVGIIGMVAILSEINSSSKVLASVRIGEPRQVAYRYRQVGSSYSKLGAEAFDFRVGFGLRCPDDTQFRLGRFKLGAESLDFAPEFHRHRIILPHALQHAL